MHADIIAIGSELVTGAKLDTNSQWLSLALAERGIAVRCHVTVGDDLSAMVEILKAAIARSELVLITGGLGPTLDDITRQALAVFAGVELVLHGPSLEYIRALFARRGREMPERNAIQAMFPAGSEPIANLRGTAPGIWMPAERPGGGTVTIAALPGVPSEMKRMFECEVAPRLPVGTGVIRRAQIHCFGLGESDFEARLGELTARGGDPDVGITAHEATITLRITAAGCDDAECAAKIDAVRSAVRERLGEFVFGEEHEELEHVVLRMLIERGLTLSTAESGTGGLLAHRLTDVANFEAAYLGGVIVPTARAKQQALGVETDGEITADVAGRLAVGCRERFGSDFALVVTDFPRFDPDRPTGEAPRVFLALAGENLLNVEEHRLLGDAALAKSRAAKAALNLLRLHLLPLAAKR